MVGFGPRRVGDGNPCFITFEAGPTHSGLESAMELATLAAQAKADAIKFQIIDPDRLISDRNQTISFQILTDKATNKVETVEERLYDILCRRALTKDQWRKLKKHCDRLGLAFFATIGFEDKYRSSASTAFLPTGTTRSLLPLPMTVMKPASRCSCSNRRWHTSEIRSPEA
jgi:sialic acid synthase SpsE